MTNDSDEVEIRYSIEVPKSVNDTIEKHITWGIKGTLVLALIKALARQLQHEGPTIIGYAIKGNIKIVPINNSLTE